MTGPEQVSVNVGTAMTVEDLVELLLTHPADDVVELEASDLSAVVTGPILGASSTGTGRTVLYGGTE